MKTYTFLFFSTIVFLGSFVGHVEAQQAWDAIKTYQYGDDFQPLIKIESDIRASHVSAESQAVAAAKLASFLNEETTLAGRQFVCLQLRFVGTAAEVPVLTKYLNRPEDFEHVRMALQMIPGEESLVPLREALQTFQGKMLIGVIESLAAREDTKSIPELMKLIESADRAVAVVAVTALGTFDTEMETLKGINAADLEQARLSALLRIAHRLCTEGKTDQANDIFSTLSSRQTPATFRRSALEGQLRILSETDRNAAVYRWFFEEDAEKNQVAASHLKELSVAQFEELTEKTDELPPSARAVFLEIAAERLTGQTWEAMRPMLEHGNDAQRLAALRTVGSMNEADVIPLLLAILKEDNAVLQTAAKDAFGQLPKEQVSPALLAVVDQPELRQHVLDILSAMKCYDAIDPLIPLAQSGDADVFIPVIAALGKICDPDKSDIPRMLKLYLSSRPGIHREHVERAIVVICEKIPDPDARANLLLEFLKNENGEWTPTILVTVFPLLGKLGNREIAEMVLPLVESDQPDLQRSAIRALCNWPNADYQDVLWNIAQKSPASEYARWALRAYVRVVTLKSDRPEAETLAMLQKAMQAANLDADKQWCLSRCSAIRTMASVEWAAGYLDDPALAQTACGVLAELAHHRFLREPNKERFVPILLQVEKTATDANTVERVKKSRLGM